MNDSPKKTAHEWNEYLDYGILDWDGFRDGTITVHDKITEEEFRRRAVQATRRFKKPGAVTQPEEPTAYSHGLPNLLSREEEEAFLSWWYKNRDVVVAFAQREPIWEARRVARCAWEAALARERVYNPLPK